MQQRPDAPSAATTSGIEATRRVRFVPRPKQARARAGGESDARPAANGSAPPGIPVAAPPGHPQPPATRARHTAPGTQRSRVHAAVAGVSLAFVLNRVLGLVRDEIIAAKFGTRADVDAYYAAFRIPDFLFLVIASGAFGAAFIPVFTRLLEQEPDERAAWALASGVLNAALYALAALAIVGFALAPFLMSVVVAPGLTEAQQVLATGLTRLLLLQPIFLGLGGAAMGILNAQRRFLAPALAPVTYNLGIIAGALFLTPRFGIWGLAYGVILGAIGHFLTQLPSLARAMRYYPVLSLRIPGMREVGTLLVPRMFGQAVFALNFVIVTNLASRLGEGRVSAFQFGYTLFLLPHGVFALSAATVLFPTLARHAAAGEWEDFRAQYAETLRGVLFFVVPAGAAMIVLRAAIPEAVYQLGAFTGASSALTATALGTLATGLIAYAVAEIATRAFYALHDTRTPVIAGVVTVAVNLPLSGLLSKVFDLGGLGLGLSVTTWLEMAILLAVLRGRVPHLTPGLLPALTRIAWATAAMVAALIPCAWLLNRLRAPAGKSIGQLLFFAVTLGIGAAVYLGVGTLLHIPEVERVRALLLRRLTRGGN